ncbi:MAG: hydroxyacylglutathione hydrolase [Pseudomonadota bacterium]
MPRLICHQYPCLSDNYGVLVHDPSSGATAAIDVPDAAPTLTALEKKGWKLSDILVTHAHWDHVQGIEEVKAKTGATVTGPIKEAGSIPALDRSVASNDTVSLGAHEGKIIDVPGHTIGHIAYWFPDDRVAFAGDALFAMGCGRMNENDPAGMWAGLDRLRALPDDTDIYCGHEYTLANGRFALSVDPSNVDLIARVALVENLRESNKPTLPTTMGQEKKTNPFLRVDTKEIRTHFGLETATNEDVFAAVRSAKDRF